MTDFAAHSAIASVWPAFVGERSFHLLLQLLEGAHFDLAHAFAADAVFLREFFERRRIVAQPPRFDDVALAVGEFAERRCQEIVALAHFFGIGKPRFLVERVVDQPVLPFGFGIWSAMAR